MIEGIEVRPVANLTSTTKRSVAKEFAYVFGKLSELSDIATTVFDKDDIRAILLAIDPRPARIRASVGFFPSGPSAVIFDVADFDAGGYFDIADPDGASFPFGGVFRVRGFVAWSSTVGVIQLVRNGTELIAEGDLSVETIYFFKAGDFVQLLVDEDVDGGDHGCVLEIEFIRPSPNPPELS